MQAFLFKYVLIFIIYQRRIKDRVENFGFCLGCIIIKLWACIFKFIKKKLFNVISIILLQEFKCQVLVLMYDLEKLSSTKNLFSKFRKSQAHNEKKYN